MHNSVALQFDIFNGRTQITSRVQTEDIISKNEAQLI